MLELLPRSTVVIDFKLHATYYILPTCPCIRYEYHDDVTEKLAVLCMRNVVSQMYVCVYVRVLHSHSVRIPTYLRYRYQHLSLRRHTM